MRFLRGGERVEDGQEMTAVVVKVLNIIYDFFFTLFILRRVSLDTITFVA